MRFGITVVDVMLRGDVPVATVEVSSGAESVVEAVIVGADMEVDAVKTGVMTEVDAVTVFKLTLKKFAL